MKLTHELKPEFIGQVIDKIEDFCDEKNISIENEELEEFYRSEGTDPEDVAGNPVKIFGSDYDMFSNELTFFIDLEYGLTTEKLERKDLARIQKVLLLRLERILDERGTVNGHKFNFDLDNKKLFCDMIEDVFRSWNLIDYNNSFKIYLTCPNCGKTDWLETDSEEGEFECANCGTRELPENMGAITSREL